MAKRVSRAAAKAESVKTPAERPEYQTMRTLHGRRSGDQLLRPIVPRKRLGDLALEASVEAVAKTVIEERRCLDKLSGAGLSACSVIGLFGPSGWGKTSLAAAIADALDQPCFAVRHGAVISSYLGDTADNLERLVEGLKGAPCVLLLDEFDSFGQSRKKDDVGEMRRVCNSLLQMMEAIPPNVLLMVASNLADYLDSAVWRRLQTVIHVGPRNWDYFTDPWGAHIRAVFVDALQGRLRGTATIETWIDSLVSQRASPADAERMGLAIARHVTIHGDGGEGCLKAWDLLQESEYWRRSLTQHERT